MVCFVDDDIVCEGYSVSEEVYLLNPVDQQSQQLNTEVNIQLLVVIRKIKENLHMIELLYYSKEH